MYQKVGHKYFGQDWLRRIGCTGLLYKIAVQDCCTRLLYKIAAQDCCTRQDKQTAPMETHNAVQASVLFPKHHVCLPQFIFHLIVLPPQQQVSGHCRGGGGQIHLHREQRRNREKDEYIHVEYLYPAMHTYQRQQCVLVPKLLLLGSLLLLLCCPLLLLLEQELFSLLCFPLLHTVVGIDPNHFRPVAKQQRIQLGHRTTTK